MQKYEHKRHDADIPSENHEHRNGFVEFAETTEYTRDRGQDVKNNGNFAKEALEINGPRSFHILNYNSPGATGAPAFGAYIVQKLIKNGILVKRAINNETIWDFQKTIAQFSQLT